MADHVIIRAARRSDISTLTRVANAANAKSVLHKRIALYQDSHPISYYCWRLLIIRQRFATPDVRTYVAEDHHTHAILGFISLAVEGPQTHLYQQWTREFTWTDWIEAKLVAVEKLYDRYCMNRSVDYGFLDRFVAQFMVDNNHASGKTKPRMTRPACVHVHQIAVDPNVQARGMGRKLINFAKRLVEEEDLPLFLESNLEATGFYDNMGFQRLTREMVVKIEGEEGFCVPVYVWEGESQMRRGRWLERDGERETWRWKDIVSGKCS